MVGNASAYWARRRGESIQTSLSDRLELLAAYNRLGHNVAAAARERRLSESAAREWINRYHSTGTMTSPNRRNSGRPRTATSASAVAKVVAAMTSPPPGAYIPTAAAVNRTLKLKGCVQSVRNAAKRGGLKFRPKLRKTFLSQTSTIRRLKWGRTAIRRSWRARTADGALLKSLLGGWKGRITDMVAAKGGRICY